MTKAEKAFLDECYRAFNKCHIVTSSEFNIDNSDGTEFYCLQNTVAHGHEEEETLGQDSGNYNLGKNKNKKISKGQFESDIIEFISMKNDKLSN